MAQKFDIRNNTAEILIFQIEGKEDGVQVEFRDEKLQNSNISHCII